VQQDLNLMKSALPADFPYDRGSVVLSAAATLCGVPFALRAVPGWDGAMSVVLLAIMSGMVVAYGGWLRRARVARGNRPRRWLCARDEFVSGGIAVAALIVYALLTRWLAEGENAWNFRAWRTGRAGPGLFAFGAGMMAFGVSRQDRRNFLGWGLALGGLGLAMPWIPSRTIFWAVGGAAMTLGGLISTAVMWRQLRRWEETHAGH
jgi:hypothetical protein